MRRTANASASSARRVAPALSLLLVALVVVGLGPSRLGPGQAAQTEGTRDDSLAGRLLVASEKMGDPRFDKSVIYMVEHSPEGAMGLVVNVPLGAVPGSELFERLGLDPQGAPGEIEVYFGGPVEPGRGFLLHSPDVLIAGSHVVDGRVALTARPEMLRVIARGEGPTHTLFALGYAGWGPGQLEAELARDAWFVIPADLSLIFASDPAESWERAAARRTFEL